jgi:CRISPR-associated protein Cas5h
MLQDLISFDLCGKVAHFRKFYATSSALTHTIPPRTTILGILAAIIGEPRDSYYENMDDLLIGVQVISPMKKIFQKFNFLKIDNKNIDQFAGIAPNRTQTSFELIVPLNIRKQDLKFRVFVGAQDKEHEKYKLLKEYLKAERNEFGITLGPAHHIGYIENVIEYADFEKNNDTSIHLSTAIKVSQVESPKGDNMSLEQDNFPMSMKINSAEKDKIKTRIASDVQSLIYSINGNPFGVNLKETDNVFSVSFQNAKFNIALS